MHSARSTSTLLLQPLAITERLPNTLIRGGSYEVITIHIDYWLVDAHYGRNPTGHYTQSWTRKHIHAKSQPTSLECIGAYLTILAWHDMKSVLYTFTVGLLMHTMVATRLDITHKVGLISTFHAQSQPTSLECIGAYLIVLAWHDKPMNHDNT